MISKLVCPKCTNGDNKMIELVVKNDKGDAVYLCNVCSKTFLMKNEINFK